MLAPMVVLWQAVMLTALQAQHGSAEPVLFPPLTITAPQSANALCADHSRQLERALTNRTLWAMHMLDASAVSGSIGALSGSVYQMGDFDQCLQADSPWPSQYCLASVHYRVPHSGAQALHHQVYRANQSVWDKVNYDGAEFHLPLDEVVWGLCVPASCDAAELQKALSAHLSGPAGKVSPAVANRIHVQHCTAPLEAIYRIDALDITFGALMVLLLVLLAAGTVLDVMTNRSSSEDGEKERLSPVRDAVICFSLRASLRGLVAPDNFCLDLDLGPVSGVRCINMMLLVCVHHVLNVFRGPVHNYLDVAHAVEEVALTGVIHGQLFVDTCFYLAGLLLAFNDLSRSRAVGLGRSLLLRYIRLTPAYAVIILFYASLLYKIGSGPVWDRLMAVERESCQHYWWANLLYINNYVPTDTLCMFQSWSMAADMHFFILGSLLLMLARRNYRAGVAVLAVLGVVSVGVPFVLTALQRWPAMLMFHPSFLKDIHRSPMFRVVYSASHNRATPYLIGIGASMGMHALHQRKFRFTAVRTWIMEVFATACLCTALFTSVVFYNPEHGYDPVEAASYAALTPVCWTTGLVVGSFGSMLGTKSMVKFATTPRVILVLSKLTYCVYLVHWIYQMGATATLRSPYHQSNFKTMQEAASDIFNSFVLALLLYLAVEAPTRMLSKRFLSPSRARARRYCMTASGRRVAKAVEMPTEMY